MFDFALQNVHLLQSCCFESSAFVCRHAVCGPAHTLPQHVNATQSSESMNSKIFRFLSLMT